MFNSTSLFQDSELPFQPSIFESLLSSSTFLFQRYGTLLFTIIPLRSSAICIFLLNLLFIFILLTCSSCFIFNFNILTYILLTVLVSIQLYTNSAGLLFRLIKSNRSLKILIIEFIDVLQYGSIITKWLFQILIY